MPLELSSSSFKPSVAKTMIERGLTLEDADCLIDRVIYFPDIDAEFERVRAITDFRRDETEARVLYIYRLSQSEDLYILKCKVQTPSKLAGGLITPVPGPSKHTLDELEALKAFASSKSSGMPHLVTYKQWHQGPDGPMPDGYIACTLMTIVPGESVLELGFWNMTSEQQNEIRKTFIATLRHVWDLGFKPYDCALRNILWKADTKELSLVDFEHWRGNTFGSNNMDEREEMEKWGLLHRRPPYYHWQEWALSRKHTWSDEPTGPGRL